MIQQDGGDRDEAPTSGVTDTGDGTGGTLGTGGAGKSGGGPTDAVTDAGDGTGGKFGTATGGKGATGGKDASDKMVEGMSEAGKRPTDPVEDQAERQPS